MNISDLFQPANPSLTPNPAPTSGSTNAAVVSAPPTPAPYSDKIPTAMLVASGAQNEGRTTTNRG